MAAHTPMRDTRLPPLPSLFSPLALREGGDAMAEARDWLLSATEDLDDVTVTPSPPRGDPWKVGM